jgi:hypothetical protein
MSHRAAFCLGFYYPNFLCKSINNKIILPSILYYNYLNVLYLVFDVRKLVGTNLIYDERR